MSSQHTPDEWVRISKWRAQRIAKILEFHAYSDDAQYLLAAKECHDPGLLEALIDAIEWLEEVIRGDGEDLANSAEHISKALVKHRAVLAKVRGDRHD